MNLQAQLQSLIQERGSIPLEDYMALCLRHPVDGYYRSQNPLGRQGDFITAPEISQLFGEMIALWCIQMWQKLGYPRPFYLCELGPGRGVLMADILRTFRNFPDLFQALHVHLIEIHPGLQQQQHQALAPFFSARPQALTWSSSWLDRPLQGPLLILANEFWDALPVQQRIWSQGQWWDHHVTWDKAKQSYELLRVPSTAFKTAPGLWEGWIAECTPEADAWLQDIGRTLDLYGGGFLWADYGRPHPHGLSTWRGFYQHQLADPLTKPGLMDQTADVNFEAFLQWGTHQGYEMTLEPQNIFLNRMGMDVRLQQMLNLNPDQEQQKTLRQGYDRLLNDLGGRFQVLQGCAL